MPNIHVTYDPFDEPVLTGEPGVSDMLIAPVTSEPQQDEELTPEEQRRQDFHEHAGTDRDRLSEGEWAGPGHGRGTLKNGTEVCQFGGWPRRHVTIGAHCPHGMLEEQDESRITDGRTA